MTTIAMTANRFRLPSTWLAWKANSQNTPVKAAVIHVAGQLRLGYGLTSDVTAKAANIGSGAMTSAGDSVLGRDKTANQPTPPPTARASIWNAWNPVE